MTIQTHKGYICRIYPNRKQEKHIWQTFGCVRFVYNRFLNEKIKLYEEEEKSIGKFEMSRMLTQLKKDPQFSWLSDVNSSAIINATRDLDTAYQNFFRRVKKGEKPGFPKFKSRSNRQSFRISYVPTTAGGNIRVVGDKLLLPKMGLMRQSGLQNFDGEILSVTITQAPSGKYFASLNVREDIEPKKNESGNIGLCLNMNHFYTDSNGNTVDIPDVYDEHKKQLMYYQKELSRAKKGSKNYHKIRKKIAREHENISNIRKDALHKASLDIVEKNDVIAICEYPLKDMMIEKKKDAKTLADISWYNFILLLEYKAFEHGAKVIKLPKEYSFIQICPKCGHEDLSAKSLYADEWVCPECGHNVAFHKNMAESILKKGYVVDKEREEEAAKKAEKKAKEEAKKKAKKDKEEKKE